MNHLYETHLDEMRTAQERHNAAIETAQIAYAEAVQASREKLAAGLDEGMTAINQIWTGPQELKFEFEHLAQLEERVRLPRADNPLDHIREKLPEPIVVDEIVERAPAVPDDIPF